MPTFQCEHCLETLEIDEFPELGKFVICGSCLTGIRDKRAKDVLDKRAKAMADQLASVTSDEIGGQVGKVKMILSDVYRCFGGTSGFASHLHSVLIELSCRSPMPAAAGQLLVSLMKLHLAIEQAEEQISTRDLSDEQIRRQQQIEITKIVMEAVGSPEKRKSLEELLGREGLLIVEEEPGKRLERVANEIGNEELEEEIEKLIGET